MTICLRPISKGMPVKHILIFFLLADKIARYE